MEQEKKNTTSTAGRGKKAKAEKSEGESITKADWEGRTIERNRAEEKAEACMTENMSGLLDATDLAHQREQIYLMFREGLTDSFIRLVCNDEEPDETCLDLLRFTALFLGEEAALSFLKRTFTLTEVKDQLADYAARGKYRQLEGIEKLAEETVKMRERFDMQLDFLEKEHDNAKKYADDLIRREREIAKEQRQTLEEKNDAQKAQLQTQIEWAKDALQNEKGTSMEKLDAASRETTALKNELELEKNKVKDLEKNLESLKEKSEKRGQDTLLSKKTDSLFIRKRTDDKRQELRRREYIASVLSNTDFSEEQLKIICHAVKSGLGQKELEQLCTPGLAPVNMQLLENFFLKSELEIDTDKGDR